MNIGLRALIVIIDGLQQKEGPPNMPQSLGNVSFNWFKLKNVEFKMFLGPAQWHNPARKTNLPD